jgi:Matrixin
MVVVRSHLRRLRRTCPRLAVPLLATLSLGLGSVGAHELPVLASAPEPWPGGRVTYVDTSGSGAAIEAAAGRWNRSGAGVRIVRAADRERADVVFVSDGAGLRSRCGPRCLGLSSTIGRPAGGHATVMLNPAITGDPTALNVWVAMHELGHVLGLRHRQGSCSLMNAQAYDDSCSFARGGPGRARLPCGPATADVATAARLYGRDEATRPCR